MNLFFSLLKCHIIQEEGITKLEFERKSSSLQKQEDENLDLVKIEKIRSNVKKLESDLISLRQCISETSSSILELIDEELLPQLVALTAGYICLTWLHYY